MKILVIRLSSLGDVVLTVPVFKTIKDAMEDSHVTVLVKSRYADVLSGHPGVDRVWNYENRTLLGWIAEIRRSRFDKIIDLHDNLRSNILSLCGKAGQTIRYEKSSWARRQLVMTKKSDPDLRRDVLSRYLVAAGSSLSGADVDVPFLATGDGEPLPEWITRSLADGPVIGLAPGAKHRTKRWLPERFAVAGNRLAARYGAKVVLFGGEEDVVPAQDVMKDLTVPAVSLVGKTSLRDLMRVIRRCVLFLTNDSGLMHIAAGLGVPTVAVFGPTVREFGFFPIGRSAVVQHGEDHDRLYCRPCSLHGTERCPEGHFRCMRELGVDRVCESAEHLLKSESISLS